MTRPFRAALVPLGALLAALVLSGCGGEDASSGAATSTKLAVQSGDTTCDVARTSVPAGTVTFAVENTGSQATEFYLLGADGKTVVSEVENIGPGLTRDLTVSLEPGVYVTRCRPGMTGDGIQAQFEVSAGGQAGTASTDPALVAASAAYATWVRSESDQLVSGTQQFAGAVKAGDVPAAKALYPDVRVHWERIEPVAESFGDLDPKLDARENDVEAGARWTGWHRLEKDLWIDGLRADSGEIADLLVSDTQDLVARMATLELTADRVTNGAKELLDEVATGKVTGEEERYSHTDLWDFQANVEGAQQSYAVMADVARAKDPELAATLDERFAALTSALDAHRTLSGFVLYTELTDAQVRELSTRVESLSEPLSRLTATILA